MKLSTYLNILMKTSSGEVNYQDLVGMMEAQAKEGYSYIYILGKSLNADIIKHLEKEGLVISRIYNMNYKREMYYKIVW